MNQKNGQLNISNNIDNIIVKLLLPITKSLLIKKKELEEKKNEFKKEMIDMKNRKQALIQKKKRILKQIAIHEKNLNGDFSNSKLCQELLINYINFVDKKETDFIKSKEDFHELKLRKKQIEFKQELIRLIKEKKNIPSKNKIKKKYTFDYLKNSNHNASYSMPKNKKYNQSFSLEKPKNNYLSKGVTSAITPDVNTIQKSEKNKNFYQRNQSAENMQTIQRNKTDISKEIETLINNYSSKKDIKVYNSESTENFDEGLNQLKVINNDMKEIEKGLKEMVSNISIDDNE